jgi:hypothetical protein
MILVQTNKFVPLSPSLLHPSYTNELFLEAQTIFRVLNKNEKRRHGLSREDSFESHFGYSRLTKLRTKSNDGFLNDSVEGAEYNYSDRLQEWYRSKHDAAWEVAKQKGLPLNSAALIEAYLQELLDDPKLSLVHILAGVNYSTGYPYRVYGYFRGTNT